MAFEAPGKIDILLGGGRGGEAEGGIWRERGCVMMARRMSFGWNYFSWMWLFLFVYSCVRFSRLVHGNTVL